MDYTQQAKTIFVKIFCNTRSVANNAPNEAITLLKNTYFWVLQRFYIFATFAK